MKFSYLKGLMLFLLISALSGNYFAQTVISLGSANQYAVMGRYVHLHNCDITGNAAIGNGSVCSPAPPYNIRFEDPGILHGTAYLQTGAIAEGTLANATGGIVYDNAMVTTAFSDAMTAYNNAIALTADETIGSVNSPTTITATHSGQYVIHVTGDIKSQLILNPSPSGITKFIVIVDGTITLGGSDIVGASTPAGAKDVLIVVKGTGTDLTSHVDNFIYGTVLAPYRGATFHGFAGAMISGCQYVKYMSDAQLTWIPFEPLPASLGDFVWNDLNMNGIQDSGEPGIPNVTVYLYNCGGTTPIASTVTDANGHYQFSNLVPGSYYVQFILPSGFVFSAKDQGSNDALDSDASPTNAGNLGKTNCYTLAAGEYNNTVDAGMHAPAPLLGSLGDFVWDDLNHNGIQDAGEPGIAGVAVELHNGIGAVIATTTTDANGHYIFNDLPAGQYYVHFTPPAGFSVTLQDVGNDALDSDIGGDGNTATITLAAGENNMTIDAGMYLPVQPASLGDFVWNDTNMNGIQDGGESGISGVIVNLYNCGGTNPIATTTTDGTGHYLFTNLAPGSYYVQFILPSGYVFSPMDQGLSDALDSDANPSTGNTICYTLTSGQSNTTVDAGMHVPPPQPAAIGDFVWEDLNQNGIQDAGEPGITGVTVELHRCSDGLLLSTTLTDGLGHYLFNNLPAGGYYIRVIAPNGFTITQKDQGLNDAVDSDIDPTTGQTGCYTLLAGQTNLTADAGLYPTPQPPTGTCLGVAARYGILGLDNGTVIINSATNLRAWVGYSDGVTSTTNQKVTSFIGKVEVHTGATFSYVAATFNPSLGIYTTGYDDSLDIANSDALFASNNYAGMPVDQTFGNVTSSLTINRTDNVTVVQMGSLNYNSQTLTLTGQAGQDDAFVINVLGNFTFADSKIQLVNVRPERVVFNFPNASTIDLYKATNVFYGTILAPTGNVTYHNPATFEGAIIAKNINLHSDFNLTQRSLDIPCETPLTASLGDFIWNDLNHNGIQESGEPGISGVTVELHKCSDNSLVATTTTNAFGYYLFNNLPAGGYYVKVIIPSGYNVTLQDAGLNDAIDSDINSSGVTGCYTLAAGQVNLTVDGGLYQPQVLLGSLGDFVWNDLNHNGIQDAGEPGIPGVPVELHDGTSAVIMTTVTDANGYYTFSSLPAGQYYVHFNPPAGYTISPEYQGGNTALDSDIGTDGNTTWITLAAGQNNPTIDAGMYLPSQLAAIGDFVWNDLNQNGIQDAGEPGIPDVIVNLFNCGGTFPIANAFTDATGHYLFSDLTPGSYFVQFTLPSGFVFSPMDQGGNDALDSDANPTNGNTICYTLTAGQTNLTVDAGMHLPSQPASVGDFVWNDLNHNGIQDNGELGIPNVVVNLYTCNNVFVATTTTDANGLYHFTNLTPGVQYYVQFVLPGGYVFTQPFQGGDNTKDSNADPLTGKTLCFSLAPGENNLTYDAGMYQPTQPASLGDFVWNDTNHNGIQDLNEPGISGVTVNLYACNSNTVIGTTTTDASGYYHFTNLVPGSYYVQFVLPTGYTFTTPNVGTNDAADSDADPTNLGKTGCYTLASGQTNNTVDAGMYPTPPAPASLGDFVWNDTNMNGIQDAGEPGIANATVNLFNCGGTTPVATTLTDGTGHYLFSNLTPGSYFVQFVLPSGFVFSSMDQGGNDALDSDANPTNGNTICYTLTAGENNMTVDAGMHVPPPQPAAIGDFVWNDANSNGIQDAGEAGVSNVTVNLYNCGGTIPIATTTTDASGYYHFTNLTPGDYFVQFVAPAGYTYTLMNQGSNDALDSDANPANAGKTACYTLAAGQTNNTVDAGLVPIPPEKASLGDFVWNDLNHNGIQETGEPGMQGVTVELHLCDANHTLVSTTTTNAAGNYLFSNLTPGSYFIKVLPPPNYSISPVNQGSDDTKDSDIGQDGQSACIPLAAGENNMTVDAGLYQTPPAPASIGDRVWNDINHNGIQEQGENGIPGVLVNLYACNSNTVLQSTTTDASGLYHFTNLAPGSYYVQFVLPTGYTFTLMNQGTDDALDSDANPADAGKTQCYSLVAGENNTTVDAGMYPTPQALASLGDFIWNDLNHNGIQESGEPGIPNVTVELHKCSDNSLVATDVTDANGIYTFTDLPAGGYYIKVNVPAGYSISPINQGTDDTKDSDIGGDGQSACVTLAAGENNMTVDAGLFVPTPQPATIGDFVWNDLNHNGIQDQGEPGIPGVTVELYRCTDNSFVASTTTDANGAYHFTGLAAGGYYVKFILPSGYTFSPMNAGADNIDSDADAALGGRTVCYTLAAGETNNTVDAGMYPTPQQTASIGDFVWNDLNHNGIQDAGEPGIPGVTVELHKCSDLSLVATTTTNANGFYSFTNLPAGGYYIKVLTPSGYSISLPYQGSDPTKDSNIGSDGQSACITLAAGENNMTIDAGLYTTPPQTACIGDFVWNDTNHNGIQDAGEVGIPGIQIELYRCTDNSLVATTVSLGNGFYSFCNVPEGSYYVKFITTGWTVSPQNQGGDDTKDSDIGADGKTACFTIIDSQNNYTIDGGLYPPVPGNNGCVGDFVWNDLNHNGIQDVNEPGIPGVTVELHDCATHALLATTMTNMFGHYQFYNVPAGSYYVKVIVPAGYNVSPANQGSNDEKDSDIGGDGQSACFNVVSGVANNSIDAGLYTSPQNVACIGDLVWYDLNHNGIQDVGEPGIYGVAVALYRCSDNVLVATTCTNYFGCYSFCNIPAGDYYVKFIVPTAYTVSPNLQGGNPAMDSNPDATGKTACFTLVGGTNNFTIDAGMYPTPPNKGSIGDFVWKDLNGNGIQDANEPGIPGVTVELRKCSDHSLVASTVTDATGHYAFTNVPAGSYFIKVLIPSGYTVSPANQGSNDAIDSDIGPDGQSACFDVIGGVTNNTIDAGLVPPVNTDLEVTKSASKSFLQCGENFTYTVTVKNNGPFAASAVVVTDMEPAGADFTSAVASQGIYNQTTGIWQVGDLAVGASATITLNAVVDCSELSSASLNLSAADAYNVFVFNNLDQSYTSIQGKVAVGGNATMSGYSTIGGGVTPGGNVVVVGGNLTMVNGTVSNGNVVYGGTTNLPQPNVTISGGTLIHATPVDFASAQAALSSLSGALAGYGANGTTAFQWGGLTLTGLDPVLNVFNVSGSDLSAANNFAITVPNGSVAVVNISGQNITWGGGMSISGAAPNHTIFNFYQAQTLKIQGLSVNGTILAPLAALDFTSGIITGQAIVKSLTGNGQFCSDPFTGNIPASKSFTNTAMLSGSIPVDLVAANNSSSATVTVGTQPGGGGEQPPICQLDGMIVAMAFDGCNFYAATQNGKIYRSTDGGKTWEPFNEGFNAAYIWALTVVDGTVFAATEQGVYAFNGTKWVLIGCGNYDVHDLVGCNGILYAATWANGVQMSTDYGLSWLPVNTGFTGLPMIQSLTAVNGAIYAATLGSGIFSLPCGGSTWTPVGTPNQSFWTIAGCQGYLYAASYGSGLFQSCDGTTWNPVTSLPCQNIYSVDVAPCGKVFVSSLMGGVFCSADNGATWTNLGFSGSSVCAVAVDPATENVYLGTKSGEIYVIESSLTGVESNGKIPTEFNLSQNYPNPFNPATTIEFAVPVAGKYTLKVYDMLGQEVVTLLNRELSVGYHKVVFDASKISSGMYIYRFTGTNVQMIRKMMLVK